MIRDIQASEPANIHSEFDIEELLSMQRSLMEKIPHGHEIKPEHSQLVLDAMSAITSILKLLNSVGFKSWRPNALSVKQQEKLRHQAAIDFTSFMVEHRNVMLHPEDVEPAHIESPGLMVADIGELEECTEFFNAIQAFTGTDPYDEELSTDLTLHAREELVDKFFFFLEQVLMFPLTPEELSQEYKRKHAINLSRYEKGKEGDFSWDKRSPEVEL